MPVSPQAAIPPTDVSLLGGQFPPGLNTAAPASDIGVSETPDSYGFDLSKDGVIAKGTIPSGAARVLKSVTLGGIPYFWAYNRLWNITNRTASTASTILTYGALFYDDIYIPQRNGKLFFDEDANTILAIQPFGGDSIFVAKASGGYVVSGINDTRAFWGRTDLIEEIECGAATGLRELNGTIYCSSANGLYAFAGGSVTEITRKVRDDLTNFGNVALTVNYEKQYIIGGTSYAYEAPTQKLFRWSGTDFRYTSRQFHMPDWSPFSVDAVRFVINRTDRNSSILKWQIKIEDDPAWSEEETLNIPFETEDYTMVKLSLNDNRACHKWQIRITDISSNLQIKEIRLDSDNFGLDGYSQ